MKKKIFSLFALLSLIFFLYGCETFPKTNDRVPAGYESYKSIEEYKEAVENAYDLVNICVGKAVFVIAPGIKEQTSISTVIIEYKVPEISAKGTTFKIDTDLTKIKVDDVKDALDNGKEVVIIIAPGVSSKGLGAAGIDLGAEITRAKEIVELNTKKKDLSDHVTIIQCNNESYNSQTDGKSVNLFNEIYAYVDCLVVNSDRVSIFRKPSIDNEFPVIEAASGDFIPVFNTMFGVSNE